jgi:hypothetical protein
VEQLFAILLARHLTGKLKIELALEKARHASAELDSPGREWSRGYWSRMGTGSSVKNVHEGIGREWALPVGILLRIRMALRSHHASPSQLCANLPSVTNSASRPAKVEWICEGSMRRAMVQPFAHVSRQSDSGQTITTFAGKLSSNPEEE